MTAKRTMQKSARTAISAVFAFVIFAVTANAGDVTSPNAGGVTPHVATVANAISASYFLGPGQTSASIFVPSFVPVHLVGVQLTFNFRGVGEVALLSVSSFFLEWVGLESTAGAKITEGFSGVPGTHIVFLDFSHQVDVQVASPITIRIHNASTGTRFGSVTLTW